MRFDVTVDKNLKLHIGEIILSVYCAEVEKIDTPASFVALLLNKETREEALSLFHQMKRTVKTHEGYSYLLSKAGNDGLAAAWQELKQLENAKPNGKPKFYRSLCFQPFNPQTRLVLTDGKEAYSFSTDVDTKQLPPNVYCKEVKVAYWLNKEKIEKAETCLEEFFAFVKRLTSIRYSPPIGTMRIFETFFTNRRRSYKLLAEAETFNQFNITAVKCPLGYLLGIGEKHGWLHGVLVSFSGEIYGFSRRRRDMADTIRSALNGNGIENIWRAYFSKKKLKEIAKRIGTLDPALALALIP